MTQNYGILSGYALIVIIWNTSQGSQMDFYSL